MEKINFTYYDKIKNINLDINDLIPYYKIKELRSLTKDPHIWSCMQSRKSGLMSHNYLFNNINNNINYFESINMNDLINSAIDSLFYGFQAFEIVWDWRGYYYPKEIIPLPQELFQKDFNNKLKININGKLEDINYNKIVFCYNNKSISNPFGISLLDKVYQVAKYKQMAQQYWINYLEKYGMPLIVAKLHRSSSDKEMQGLLDNLKNMVGNNILISPKDLDVEYKESQRSEAVEIFMNLIEITNTEISKAILSQTLTTEIKQGSLAAAQTHLQIRDEIIEADAILIEGFINSIINLISKINNNKLEIKFNFILNDEDKNVRLERDVELSKIGLKFSNSYWKKTYNLTDEDII